MLKAGLTILLIALPALARGESIARPLNTKYQTLESKHFKILFLEPHVEVAKEFLVSAEKARFLLSSNFKEMPDKVTIFMDDSSDLANGYSTAFPIPTIGVYPVFPDDGSVLNNYGNWSEILLLHEYTHSLQFEPVHGFYRPLRWIFGSVIIPNSVLPTWMLEGVATEYETRLSPFGRMRSNFYNARLRAIAMDGLLKGESLSRIDADSIPTYPFGERPYFYGGLLSHEVSISGKPELWSELLQSYSRLVPFTYLNTTLAEKINTTYFTLLERMYDRYEALVREQMKTPRETVAPVDATGDIHSYPSISPDGKLMVYSEFTRGYGLALRLVRQDAQGKWDFSNSVRIKKIKQPVSVSWSVGSDRIIFDDVYQYKRVYQTRDISEVNLTEFFDPKKKHRATRRLTKGLRSFAPIYLGDDSRLAWLRYSLGYFTEIVTYDRSSKKTKLIKRSQLGERFSGLAFDRKNNALLYLAKNKNGEQSLYRISLLTEENAMVPVRWKNKELRDLSGLVGVSDGFLFYSEITGTRNVFWVDPDFRDSYPISDTATYVHSAAVTPTDVWASELTGKGNRLFKMALARHEPQAMPKLIDGYPPPLDSGFKPEEVKIAEGSYSALPYMLPNYWIPSIFPVQGGTLLQALTGASDPIGRHAYSFLGEYDTYTEKAGYTAAYTNTNRLRTISLYSGLAQSPVSYNSRDVSSSQVGGIQSNFFASSDTTYPLLLGYNYYDVDYAGILQILRHGPLAGVAYNNDDLFFMDKQLRTNQFVASVVEQKFLAQEQFTAYDQLSVEASLLWSAYLPKNHQISWSVKGQFAPTLDFSLTPVLGQTTVGGNYYLSLVQSPLLLRGYSTSVFRGRQLINTNLEYSFDLFEQYWGLKYAPVFFKKTRMNLFLDGITLDGYYESTDDSLVLSRDFKDQFFGVGSEFIFETTLAHQFDFNLIVGLYYGFEEKAYGGFSTFVGLIFGDMQRVGDANNQIKIGN